jgi:hypothetical protein
MWVAWFSRKCAVHERNEYIWPERQRGYRVSDTVGLENVVLVLVLHSSFFVANF